MRHDLTLVGHAFRLRPIEDADGRLVLALRGNPELNRYLHNTSKRLEDQLDWFARYYERQNDYYFVIERNCTGIAEGVVAIYDIDSLTASGEWGRWILKPGSLAAIESAWLIYRCAFEKLGLEQVSCRTVAENRSIISFHDSCGIVARRMLPSHFDVGGKCMDAIEHQVTRESWPGIAARLEKLAQLTARRLHRD